MEVLISVWKSVEKGTPFPWMLQKADIGEAAVYRRSVDRSRTFSGSGYCSECRTVFCGSFETESVQKEMDVLSVVVFSGGPDRDRLRQIL